MSDFKKNPLEITDEVLEQVFGGTGAYVHTGGTSACTPMTPKCANFIFGANSYIGVTLRNTCGQCKYFRQSGSLTECLFKK